MREPVEREAGTTSSFETGRKERSQLKLNESSGTLLTCSSSRLYLIRSGKYIMSAQEGPIREEGGSSTH